MKNGNRYDFLIYRLSLFLKNCSYIRIEDMITHELVHDLYCDFNVNYLRIKYSGFFFLLWNELYNFFYEMNCTTSTLLTKMHLNFLIKFNEIGWSLCMTISFHPPYNFVIRIFTLLKREIVYYSIISIYHPINQYWFNIYTTPLILNPTIILSTTTAWTIP